MDYRYLGSIFRGPLTGVTIGYYPTRIARMAPPRSVPVRLESPAKHQPRQQRLRCQREDDVDLRAPAARKALGRPKRCKLAHALLWEY
jgi:hypothetical protein